MCLAAVEDDGIALEVKQQATASRVFALHAEAGQ